MQFLQDALLFPIQLHERGPDPGPFSDHHSYKPYLQDEFRSKCVYCRVPDGLAGPEGFGVDHYLPKSKFPELSLEWSNLFYACNVCNTWKGAAVSTRERFLPNPCEHRMADHLQYRGTEIEVYTLHGQWLTDLMHLKERRSRREMLLSAVSICVSMRSQLLLDLTALENKKESASSHDDLEALEAAIRRTSEEIERLESHLEQLTGEPIPRSTLPAAR